MNLILLGPPGAGKGTQAQRLQSVLGLPHVASGDIFRDIRRSDSALAREVRQFMDRGQYVPDDLTIELVLQRLCRSDASHGFILDGFPRTLPQAEALDRAMVDEGRALSRALYFDVPNEILTVRIHDRIICPQCHAIYNDVTRPPHTSGRCDSCGHALERRTDEEADILSARLDQYIQQTRPLVEYYRARGILTEIDGARPMAEVDEDVDDAIAVRGRS